MSPDKTERYRAGPGFAPHRGPSVSSSFVKRAPYLYTFPWSGIHKSRAFVDVGEAVAMDMVKRAMTVGDKNAFSHVCC